MIRRLLALLTLCFLVALPAAAQTVDDIIARNIEARGGLARLQAVQTVRITGRQPFGPQPTGMDQPLAGENVFQTITEAKRPNLWREIVVIRGMTGVQYDQAVRNRMVDDTTWDVYQRTIQRQLTQELLPLAHLAGGEWFMTAGFDGKTGWRWNSRQGGVETVPNPGAQPGFALDSPLEDYRARGYKVELQGKARAEGKNCYKLRVTREDGDVLTMFIDATTYLDVIVEATTTMPDPRGKTNPVTVRTAYRDWKAADGIMMARTILTTVGSFPAQRKTIDKVEFNVPLDDSRFARPAPTK